VELVSVVVLLVVAITLSKTIHRVDAAAARGYRALVARAGDGDGETKQKGSLNIASQATAMIDYNWQCSWQNAFMLNPSQKGRMGYITAFNGLGMSAALKADLTVSSPDPTLSLLKSAQISVIAMIKSISWNGDAGGPFSISCYMSQENAVQLKTLQQSVLKTTTVSALGFVLVNFDTQLKSWFQEVYPVSPLQGMINQNLNVQLEGVPVSSGIDVLVYEVDFQISPAANFADQITVATSKTVSAVKQWGLVVGTVAANSGP